MEIEYVTRDHGVSLRNVPSLLRNLLETGLQLDDAKRTLDMDKIGRELHRLLVVKYTYYAMIFFQISIHISDSLCAMILRDSSILMIV